MPGVAGLFGLANLELAGPLSWIVLVRKIKPPSMNASWIGEKDFLDLEMVVKNSWTVEFSGHPRKTKVVASGCPEFEKSYQRMEQSGLPTLIFSPWTRLAPVMVLLSLSADFIAKPIVSLPLWNTSDLGRNK